MKYIIISNTTRLALYGVNAKTILCDTKEEAIKMANWFFRSEEDYYILSINI